MLKRIGRNFGKLKLIDFDAIPRMLPKLGGGIYDSGEIEDYNLKLRCVCGYEFELLESKFILLDMKTCDQDSCTAKKRTTGYGTPNEPKLQVNTHFPLSVFNLLDADARKLDIKPSGVVQKIVWEHYNK